MAGFGYQFQCLVLLCFVLCLACHVAGKSSGRASRSSGGVRISYRSTRYSSGSSYSNYQSSNSTGGHGGGSADVGMIIGIVFGCIGAITLIAVIAYVIYRCYCKVSSSAESKPPSSGPKDEIKLDGSVPVYTTAESNSFDNVNQYTAGPQDDQNKSQFGDTNFAPYPANPPSYDAAVTGYGSSQPNGATPEHNSTPAYNSTPGYDPSPYPQTAASAPVGFEPWGYGVDSTYI